MFLYSKLTFFYAPCISPSHVETKLIFIFISGSKYGTSYPLGIHRFTFTGLMCNLYLRIIVPSTIPAKTVHSKAVGTSQFNESDFAQLSQMPQCTNGTPPALLIGEFCIVMINNVEMSFCQTHPKQHLSSTMHQLCW